MLSRNISISAKALNLFSLVLTDIYHQSQFKFKNIGIFRLTESNISVTRYPSRVSRFFERGEAPHGEGYHLSARATPKSNLPRLSDELSGSLPYRGDEAVNVKIANHPPG